MDYKPRLKAQLEIVRQTLESLLASFRTPQDWTYQVHPQANHALWVAGHLSVADHMIVSRLAPEMAASLPSGYKEKFAPGSKPSPDPNDYPPPDSVLALMREKRAEFLAFLDSLSESDLAKPAPKGGPGFIKDIAGFFEFVVFHESTHMGQVTVARRALGHPPLFGGAPS
jgi:uncharacterized damage-inducible protein DinB